MNVEIQRRDGVDPLFRFDHVTHQSSEIRLFQETSDVFFTHSADDPYDIIFLDGLHTFHQTLRDFLNSLAFAHRKTVWVIDDTMPVDIFSAHPDQQTAYAVREKHGRDSREWHGDVYKMVPFIHDYMVTMSWLTVTRNGNPQTVVWHEARDDFQPRFGSLENIDRLDYYAYVASLEVFNTCDSFDEVVQRLQRALSA